MKKIYYLLIILLFINLSILIPKSYNTTIATNLITNYSTEQNTSNKESLKKQIISNVLTATNNSNWNEYMDYIDLKLYNHKLPSKDKEFLFITLNLSKDSALIAVYEKNNSIYNYKYKISSLSPIKDISFFDDFIIVNQTLDERIGAFFVDNFIEIYYLKDTLPIKSFRQSIYYDELFKDSWINKDAPNNKWTKNTKESSFTYVDDSNPQILSILKQTQYEAFTNDIPEKKDLKKVNENSIKKIYIFDNSKKEFKLQNNTKKEPLTN